MRVLDEKTYAEGLLKKGLSKFMHGGDLLILAKYFRHNGSKNVEKDLIDYCYKFEPDFNEVIFFDKLAKIARTSKKSGLRTPIDIPVTENEYSQLRNIKNYKLEKVLFAMLFLGKYYKLTNVRLGDLKENYKQSKYYYTENNMNYLLRLAHVGRKKTENLFHELYKMGLIDHLINGNRGIFVLKFTDMEDSSPIKLYITDILNIMSFYKPVCEKCGVEIVKNSNRQYLCKECYCEVKAVKMREISKRTYKNKISIQ